MIIIVVFHLKSVYLVTLNFRLFLIFPANGRKLGGAKKNIENRKGAKFEGNELMSLSAFSCIH